MNNETPKMEIMKRCSKVILNYCYNAILRFANEWDDNPNHLIFCAGCTEEHLIIIVNTNLRKYVNPNRIVAIDFGDE